MRVVRSRREVLALTVGQAPQCDVDPEANVAVQVSHLRKTYGAIAAVDDVSFSVQEGDVFGILGPNGAGTTTTVECVIGLRSADGGRIRVTGLDPKVDREALHALVGTKLQASALPPRLKLSEILDLSRSFCPSAANPEDLMDALGLGQKRDAYYRSECGGPRSTSPRLLLNRT